MNRLLILSLVGCLLSVTAKSLPLKAICADDHFEYEDQTVNAYLKLQLENEFESLENLTIEVPEGLEAICEDVCMLYAQKIVQIKDEFNRMLQELYTEKYLSSIRENADLEKKQNQLLRLKMETTVTYQTIFILTSGQDVANEVQVGFQERFTKMDHLLESLQKLKQGMVNELLLSESQLNSTLDGLGELPDGQHAVFGKQSRDAFYSQSLYQLDSIRVNKQSKLFFNKQVTATATYSLYIPFVSPKPIESGACSNATALPLFFRKRSI